ncbi:MAG: ABC transporter permease subunit [Pirellulaceae bacterium]|jgi:hypothetical protein|nr:ABC transporter permease subunit [Pirellulaceae bacterium]MDP7016400.1 ABC transporter permease subunit [Pirellulaceae bacterium]
MRPYWTVIKDSFHEAFVSRVLWILLAFSTLLLGALAPVGLRDERAIRLHVTSVRDWRALISQIKQESQADAPSPGKQVWELASPKFRKAIDGAVAGEGRGISRDVVGSVLGGLNELLTNPKLHDEAAWGDATLSAAASEVLDAGVDNASAEDLAFLNRSLLKAGFPAAIAGAPDEELFISYLGRSVAGPLPINRTMAEPAIKSILGSVVNTLLGVIAVFVAILVTAPIIPNTFEAGAIDLLLSKPVSRPLLFLVKFIGGCAFILLNAGYFVVGLWLILGVRFGIWHTPLLWCIPLFLFRFAIYYSVSAAAAVRWKNTIVAVVVTILFWALCFTVGSAKSIIETAFLDPFDIVDIVPVADSEIAVNQAGQFVEWRTDSWEVALQSTARRRGGPFGGPITIGPIYDAQHEELLFIQNSPGGRRFSFGGSSMTRAKWIDGAWKTQSSAQPPSGASWMFSSPAGVVTIVGVQGVYEWDAAGGKREVLGVPLPFGGTGPYNPVGPDPPLNLVEPFAAAMNPVSGDIVVLSGKTLQVLKREEEKYIRAVERDLPDLETPAALAFGGDNILVAQSDGNVSVLDAANLESQSAARPAGNSEPFALKTSPNGKQVALLFHNNKLFLFNQSSGFSRVRGRVTGVHIDGDQLIVAEGRRLTRRNIETLAVDERTEPPATVLTTIYGFVIYPLYTVLPKPSELGDVVTYLVTDQQSIMAGPPGVADLRQSRQSVAIWRPILTTFAFIAFVLAATCVYISRTDI